MAYLILVRHGQSLWNAQGLWTGWTDISLSDAGKEEAKLAAKTFQDIQINIAYTSTLTRAKETLQEILKENKQEDITVVENPALNERNYGDYTGKNKWQIKEAVGEEEFLKIRRGWDFPIPNGESLKDVYQRVVPFYQEIILPKLKENKNVLISAHGNSLRALVKYLENISDQEIPNLEMATGEVYIYQIDPNGKIISKDIKNSRPNIG